MLRSTFRTIAAATAAALLTAGIVAVSGAPAEATTVVHIQKAPVGSCLAPRVTPKTVAGDWVGGEPFYFAEQSWRLASGNSDTYMNRVPCSSSHAVEIFAAKQLWTSASQIPSPGTTAFTKLITEQIRPFCKAKARQFLGLPSTANPPHTSYWPSKAQATALGNLSVKCAFTDEVPNNDGSSTMYSIGNKSWKYTKDAYFAVTPVAPRVASASLTCAAVVGGGFTVTRKLRVLADQRWMVPTRVDLDGVPFLVAQRLTSPSGDLAVQAFPVQKPSSVQVYVTQTWTVPDGTVDITAPGTVTTRWTTAVGKRVNFAVTTTATAISTTSCTPLV